MLKDETTTTTWYACKSQKYNREYYFNPTTNQSTWVLPDDEHPMGCLSTRASTPTSQIEPSSKDEGHHDPLPKKRSTIGRCVGILLCFLALFAILFITLPNYNNKEVQHENPVADIVENNQTGGQLPVHFTEQGDLVQNDESQPTMDAPSMNHNEGEKNSNQNFSREATEATAENQQPTPSSNNTTSPAGRTDNNVEDPPTPIEEVQTQKGENHNDTDQEEEIVQVAASDIAEDARPTNYAETRQQQKVEETQKQAEALQPQMDESIDQKGELSEEGTVGEETTHATADVQGTYGDDAHIDTAYADDSEQSARKSSIEFEADAIDHNDKPPEMKSHKVASDDDSKETAEEVEARSAEDESQTTSDEPFEGQLSDDTESKDTIAEDEDMAQEDNEELTVMGTERAETHNGLSGTSNDKAPLRDEAKGHEEITIIETENVETQPSSSDPSGDEAPLQQNSTSAEPLDNNEDSAWSRNLEEEVPSNLQEADKATEDESGKQADVTEHTSVSEDNSKDIGTDASHGSEAQEDGSSSSSPEIDLDWNEIRKAANIRCPNGTSTSTSTCLPISTASDLLLWLEEHLDEVGFEIVKGPDADADSITLREKGSNRGNFLAGKNIWEGLCRLPFIHLVFNYCRER